MYGFKSRFPLSFNICFTFVLCSRVFTENDFGVSENFNPLHVLTAIFEVDVGVAGDNLAKAFVSEVAGHNEALLGSNGKLEEIVHQQ